MVAEAIVDLTAWKFNEWLRVKKIRQTVVPEICVVLAIFIVTMLPLDNFIGILALFIVMFALILLLLRISKRRRDAAARARMIELIDASTQQNDNGSRF